MRPSKLGICTIIWLAVALMGSGSVLAGIIAVPGDQTTIQAAIDLAVTGDIVLVDPGTYPENINFNGKQITVASWYWDTGDEAYIASTIIDGTASGSVVTFDNSEGNDSILVGFSLTNGQALIGGGISCIEADPTIHHCKIFGNVATEDGAGIRLFDASPQLSDLEVYDNVGGRHGGGINISQGLSSPSIRRSSFHHNTAANGGGIWCYNGASPVVEQVDIVRNTATTGGGVFCFENSTAHFSGVTIANNFASSSGGGIICQFGSHVTLVNSIIWGNDPQEVLFQYGVNTIGVAYSDVQDGEAGIITAGYGTVSWLDGNINQNPQFADAPNDDFELLPESPCIDSGVAYFEHQSEVWVSLVPGEYNGSAPDMGALESDPAIGDIDPEISGLLNCSQTITLTFNYTANEYTQDMFLYNAVVSATPGLIFGAVVDLEPFGNINNSFFPVETGTNEWTITGSTVGNPSYPVSGEGTTGLFSITFSATADVVGSVQYESLVLRDPDNNTIPVVLTGASITYDCTAPDMVTGITADPHHNRVEVAWDHSGSDVDHYEVFSGLWHDGAHASVYPEYDDVPNAIPTRPADYAAILANSAEWDHVGDVAALTMDELWPDATERGVYYYEVFAVDAAGNPSIPAAANDRATNYWLGDIFAMDGTVGVLDMDILGDTYGLVHGVVGPPAYNNFCDVGPTDDWSRVGIPTTDDHIGFEDLMVFAMNFGVVQSNNKNQTVISPTANLAWVDVGNGRYALRLIDGSGVKGVHVRANLPEGSITAVTAGQLLDEQGEPTFLKNIGNSLDTSVAVMGQGNGFAGSGDLFLVDSGAAIAVSDLAIEIRGHDNSVVQLSMDETEGTVTPRVFALKANYPNPFNPVTKISFSLPESQEVLLSVYSVDGTRVATLVNESRPAGLHEILWTGRDDAGRAVASGMYFYRIKAGPYSQVRKMTLMK